MIHKLYLEQSCNCELFIFQLYLYAIKRLFQVLEQIISDNVLEL